MKIRWPWRKPKTDLHAARKAVDDAHRDWARVRRVSGRADELKRANGFGNMIVRAMGGDDQ